MSFITKNISIPGKNYLEDRSVCDPLKVIEIVSSCNTYGKEDALWGSFRLLNALPPSRKRAFVPTQATLAREERACLLFDIMMQYLKREKFVYTYTSGGGGLFGSSPIDNGAINCKDCATSFASLLYAFGFDPANLFWNLSNPDDSRDIKVMAKPELETLDGTIMGYKGSDISIAPDAPKMPGVPLVNGRSNAFRLKYQKTSVMTDPCDRDPFLNHFVVFVDGLNFNFPYFDALTGRRYKNGQQDLFTMYHHNPAGDLHYWHGNNESVQMYAREESPDARLYTVPQSMSFQEAAFQQAKLIFKDQGLFFVIDPPDWHLKPVTPARPQTPPQTRPMMMGHQRMSTFSHPEIILEALGVGSQ